LRLHLRQAAADALLHLGSELVNEIGQLRLGRHIRNLLTCGPAG
jgi:hypothetical protein